MTTIYGVHYNSCIHESAYALQTLHHTKAAAFKAMVAARNKWWQDELDNQLSFSGMHGAATKRHELIDRIRMIYRWRGWSIQEWGIE